MNDQFDNWTLTRFVFLKLFRMAMKCVLYLPLVIFHITIRRKDHKASILLNEVQECSMFVS